MVFKFFFLVLKKGLFLGVVILQKVEKSPFDAKNQIMQTTIQKA